MSRAVDRGANVAAMVGIGMALTIAVSFLMVIPIDPAYLILAPLSGLLIGWYGNQRAEQLRSRPGRVLANAAWSGGVTAVTFAALFLGVKLFFFSLDPGYRDERSGGSFTCAAGPACVYERYLAADGGEAALAEAGINDVASFTAWYWDGQMGSARLVIGSTLLAAIDEFRADVVYLVPTMMKRILRLPEDVRALAREWGRKRVYLAPGGWGNGHGGACRNQTGIQWARVMVCLSAMQGLGKPGCNMGNLQWGTPVDFNFYFPGYAEGGMSGDIEGTSLPVELYQRMPQLPTMNTSSQKIPRIKLDGFNYKYTAVFEEGKPGQAVGHERKVKGVRLSGGYYFGPARRRR